MEIKKTVDEMPSPQRSLDVIHNKLLEVISPSSSKPEEGENCYSSYGDEHDLNEDDLT